MTKHDVKDLIGDFERAMQATTQQIKQDLERARSVVRDSAWRLERSVNALQLTTSAHREALEAVARAFHEAEHASGGFAASSEALLRQFSDEIVRVSHDSAKMLEQLSELSAKVDSITGCADAIDVLARETRFIAFNARIETHRAGDAGRTFKVVADEVKRLANASSTLSNQIRQSVSECQTELQAVHRTSTGLASHEMGRTIESHRNLTGAVAKLDGVNRELDQLLESLTGNVAEATRALQFEQLVSQILSATIRRTESMGELSVRALQVIERGHNGDRAAPLAEIVQSLRSLGDRSPGLSSAPEPGRVERF
jgi:methyl-accepting chemotaxis protein